MFVKKIFTLSENKAESISLAQEQFGVADEEKIETKKIPNICKLWIQSRKAGVPPYNED